MLPFLFLHAHIYRCKIHLTLNKKIFQLSIGCVWEGGDLN